jgi:hypothetical protein
MKMPNPTGAIPEIHPPASEALSEFGARVNYLRALLNRHTVEKNAQV